MFAWTHNTFPLQIVRWFYPQIRGPPRRVAQAVFMCSQTFLCWFIGARPTHIYCHTQRILSRFQAKLAPSKKKSDSRNKRVNMQLIWVAVALALITKISWCFPDALERGSIISASDDASESFRNTKTIITAVIQRSVITYLLRDAFKRRSEGCPSCSLTNTEGWCWFIL